MSHELDINTLGAKKGMPQVLNLGFLGTLVFIGLYIFGVYTLWSECSGFFTMLWKMIAYTFMYILIAGVGGIIGNALRLYAMPRFYLTSGMWSILRIRLFWAAVPQSIGIIIGGCLALGIFLPAK